MRKSVIGSAGILFDIVMFFVGFFFLYWGLWNYLFGSRLGLFFGVFMVVFGATMLGLGVLVALRLYAFFSSRSRKSPSAT